MAMSRYYSDIGTIEVDAYINTRRAQVDSIQTINRDEIAASNGNCNSREGFERTRRVKFDKLSTIFTIVGVQKSVSARRLLGLHHFTLTIHQLGIL